MEYKQDFKTLDKKICFKELTLSQLQDIMLKMGEKKFRSRQIATWMFQKGVSSFHEMTDLPLDLRTRLDEIGYPGNLKIIKKQVSRNDGTKKYLFELEDGNAVESVLMLYKHGRTACVSTQVGCKMGCTLCASGMEGWIRDLKSYEIYEQVIAVQNDTGERISNVVLMGSGEPLDNYDNTIKFISRITSEQGLNISQRSITLSTCGLVPQIRKLCSEGFSITLAVSLHAAYDNIRNSLMPVNNRYPLAVLLPVCREYAERSKRRITFEYALINDINDAPEHARELAHKLKNIFCLVNLIPANEVPELGVRKSPKNRIEEFKNILTARNINVTVRRELGADIDAACGQLRRRILTRR
ncbi:MAG: 23S rRNA (adenine(2503)-C(2))-methyltransferase RlmN [Clostridiales bacterium]|nr:23S rRNA (adenine(2503)-C(2))-methyltransferase RlmN [Clostridiales bacterium]MCF8022714.1 23S rRNA (adenine(2503)-C(2))-methyltransferase RlmN [Clostridiales bacterium]